MISFDKNHTADFTNFLVGRGLVQSSINQYLFTLPLIKEPLKYFRSKTTKNKSLKYTAYINYLRFLRIEKKLITSDEIATFKDQIVIKKPKGSKQMRSIPKGEYTDYIKKAHNSCSKMGLWLGFQFGFRLSEIVNLRIEDIDFKNQEILIRPHGSFIPKHNRSRQLPLANFQSNILKKWINDRPNLEHNYLIWGRNKQQLHPKTFQRWINKLGIKWEVLD